MRITSPAFSEGSAIPKRHTGFGEDLSPEIRIDGLPESAASVAVLLEDLDVPFAGSLPHWIIWNILPTAVIPEGIPFGETLTAEAGDCLAGAVQGAAWGKHLYRGPKQPFFINKAHRYRFTVYALDKRLSLPASEGKNGFLSAAEGSIIDKAELTGVYKP